MPAPQFWAVIGNTVGAGARDYANTANADKDMADGMAAIATYIASIAGNRPGTMTAEKHESVSSSLDELADDRHLVTELADDMTPFFSSGAHMMFSNDGDSIVWAPDRSHDGQTLKSIEIDTSGLDDAEFEKVVASVKLFNYSIADADADSIMDVLSSPREDWVDAIGRLREKSFWENLFGAHNDEENVLSAASTLAEFESIKESVENTVDLSLLPAGVASAFVLLVGALVQTGWQKKQNSTIESQD